VTTATRSEAPTNSLDTLRALFGSAHPPKRYDTRGTAISFSRTAHELVRRHLPVGPSQLWRPPSFPALSPLVAALSLVLPLVLARSRSSFGGGLFSSTWCLYTPSPPFPSPSPLSWTQSVFSSVLRPVLAVVVVGLASPFLRGSLARSLVTPGRHRMVPGGSGHTSSLIGPWLGLSR